MKRATYVHRSYSNSFQIATTGCKTNTKLTLFWHYPPGGANSNSDSLKIVNFPISIDAHLCRPLHNSTSPVR